MHYKVAIYIKLFILFISFLIFIPYFLFLFICYIYATPKNIYSIKWDNAPENLMFSRLKMTKKKICVNQDYRNETAFLNFNIPKPKHDIAPLSVSRNSWRYTGDVPKRKNCTIGYFWRLSGWTLISKILLRGGAIVLRLCACSIPDGVIGIFHWHNPSGRTMALGSTQLLRKMSTRRTFWRVKTTGALGWQPCHLHLRTV